MRRQHLTQKQQQFLEFLRTHIRVEETWPTYREIVDHFDYRSPNSVTQNLQALTKKGFLRRDRNGYHLKEPTQADGALPVRAVIRDGAVDLSASPDWLTFSTLFSDRDILHALRLDSNCERSNPLRDAEYVLIDHQEVPEGEVAVVLCDGCLSLRLATPDGRFVDPDGDLDPIERTDDAELLGRYAGHVAGYGVVLYPSSPSHPYLGAVA